MKAWTLWRSTAIGLGLAASVLLVVLAVAVYSSIELARFEHAQMRRAVFMYAGGQALALGVRMRAIGAQFMKQVLDAYPAPDFIVPGGIITANIDATNGNLAGDACPLVVRETFLIGTGPEPCDEHGGFSQRIENWWRELRDWLRR